MAERRQRPPVTPRAETSAATRAALLEAGAGLLREQPVGTVMSQVKAPAVAERAGRTIGAFYHHWESQDAYQRDLIAYVLDPARIPSTAEAVTAIAAGLDRNIPAEELLHLAAHQNFEGVRADPYVPLWFALWSRQGRDPEVRELLRANYRGVTAQLVPVLEALIEASGRRLRPPFTVEMFAVTATALVQGLALRVATEPEAVPLQMAAPSFAAEPGGEPGGPWDLFSALMVTLLRGMTADAPECEPR